MIECSDWTSAGAGAAGGDLKQISFFFSFRIAYKAIVSGIQTP